MDIFKNIDYDNCITNLTSSIQKYYNIKPNYKTLKMADELLHEKEYENVIVFVFDAMGYSIILNNTTENHFLQKNMIGTFKATFPPTTANATTSYLSGINPISNGWLGWSTHYKDTNMTIDNFPNVDSISKEKIDGEHIAYNRLKFKELGECICEFNKDVSYHSIYPSFKENGCRSLKEFEHRIVKLCNTPGKKYIYAYWDEPDKSMHMEGTNTPHIKKILNSIAKTLKNIQRKTKNTIGFVSADHSQIDVKPIALYTYYDILNCLYAPVSCDSRCAFFFVKEDKKDEFIKLFNENFKDLFILYSKDDVLKNNLFGQGKKHPQIDNILGDFVAISISEYYFLTTPDGHLFKGHHAGGLLEEMIIPLIIIKN